MSLVSENWITQHFSSNHKVIVIWFELGLLRATSLTILHPATHCTLSFRHSPCQQAVSQLLDFYQRVWSTYQLLSHTELRNHPYLLEFKPGNAFKSQMFSVHHQNVILVEELSYRVRTVCPISSPTHTSAPCIFFIFNFISILPLTLAFSFNARYPEFIRF